MTVLRMEASSRRGRPRDPSRTTAAVSFGMPSMAPAVWTADLRRARRALPRGKVLIVSVVASPEAGESRKKIVADFCRLAEMAREAGAQVVEANLSCPNVATPEGFIFEDSSFSREVMKGMARAASGIPVIAKAGHFQDRRALRSFLRALDGPAAGVLLLNAPPRQVLDPGGQPAFGPSRKVCGVIGRRIASACLENVESAGDIVKRDRLELKILAGGGVLTVEDPRRYFEAGAHAVMMGGAPMYDPRLAIKMKRAHPEW